MESITLEGFDPQDMESTLTYWLRNHPEKQVRKIIREIRPTPVMDMQTTLIMYD